MKPYGFNTKIDSKGDYITTPTIERRQRRNFRKQARRAAKNAIKAAQEGA